MIDLNYHKQTKQKNEMTIDDLSYGAIVGLTVSFFVVLCLLASLLGWL